jgi:signal transduction histidine kinase
MDNNSPAAALRGDADLLAGVAARQPEALLELYDRYSRAAYALAARMLGDAGRAEECTHAAFLEVWRHPPPAEPTGVEFSAWLLAAVHRNAYARQRAAVPDTQPSAGAAPTSNGAEHLAVDRLPEPPGIQTHIQDEMLGLQAGLTDASGPDDPATGPSAQAAQDVPARARPDPVRDAPRAGSGAGTGIYAIGELRRLDQQQDQLLVLVGHELKTPITVIKATVQLTSQRLRRAGHLAEAAHLDMVDAQLDRLTALVEYLLLAGQRNGVLDLHLVHFDLADLAREVGTAMQALSTVHTLIIQAPEHLDVEGDSARLTQVLHNLIANAIKYSPTGGAIEVTLVQVAETAELCVRDYGIGLPAEDRTQVFERFHRASNVGAIPGFGLGLVMSRDIVQAHHGRLWVGDLTGTSAATLERPGRPDTGEAAGSLLCLVLPLQQEHGP